MSTVTKLVLLLGSMLLILFLPWLGAWFYYDHGQFPSGFFAYPPLEAMPKSPFNLYVFLAMAIVCLGMTLVYIFPSWFGFKETIEVKKRDSIPVKLPYWFWVGAIAWVVSVFFQSTQQPEPAWFVHWSDLPLFWGTVLILDGWVYIRNNGRSLIALIPQEIIGIGVASVSGWMIFEFLNFFVDDNWYYPSGQVLDREEFLLYACVISSGLLPIAFEWYCVFKTFPKLRNRFSNGIPLRLSGTMKLMLLLVALTSMFASGLFPDSLFFTLWLSPPVIIAVVLDYIGVWTPLKPIGKGNWTPTILSALTYFFAGFCLEGQNYFSADSMHTSFDPAYWRYSLPYVDVLHVFEMPLLGLYGYLPFGIYCWLWWIAFATLLNIPARFLNEEPLDFD